MKGLPSNITEGVLLSAGAADNTAGVRIGQDQGCLDGPRLGLKQAKVVLHISRSTAKLLLLCVHIDIKGMIEPLKSTRYVAHNEWPVFKKRRRESLPPLLVQTSKHQKYLLYLYTCGVIVIHDMSLLLYCCYHGSCA